MMTLFPLRESDPLKEKPWEEKGSQRYLFPKKSRVTLALLLCVLALEQGADGGDHLLPQSYPPGLALKFQHHVKPP